MAKLIVILCLVFALPWLSGCSKSCETAEGCAKTCQCTEVKKGFTFDCNMTFLCDSESDRCEPGHGESCEKICQKYAAINACGRRCEEDAHCTRRCECNEDAGLVFCEKSFACGEKSGTCEADYNTISCEKICRECLQNL